MKYLTIWTVLILFINHLSKAQENCFVINFENGISLRNGIECKPHFDTSWEWRSYQEVNIEQRDVKSSRLMLSEIGVCDRTVGNMQVHKGGIIEAKIYMNTYSVASTAFVRILLQESESHRTIVEEWLSLDITTNGWHTITMNVPEDVEEAYILIVGYASRGSVLLMDYLRYVQNKDYLETCTIYPNYEKRLNAGNINTDDIIRSTELQEEIDSENLESSEEFNPESRTEEEGSVSAENPNSEDITEEDSGTDTETPEDSDEDYNPEIGTDEEMESESATQDSSEEDYNPDRSTEEQTDSESRTQETVSAEYSNSEHSREEDSETKSETVEDSDEDYNPEIDTDEEIESDSETQDSSEEDYNPDSSTEEQTDSESRTQETVSAEYSNSEHSREEDSETKSETVEDSDEDYNPEIDTDEEIESDSETQDSSEEDYNPDSSTEEQAESESGTRETVSAEISNSEGNSNEGSEPESETSESSEGGTEIPVIVEPIKESFWNPLTITGITILCALVFLGFAVLFYKLGKRRARKQMPPFTPIYFDDLELPKGIVVPRVVNAYSSHPSQYYDEKEPNFFR